MAAIDSIIQVNVTAATTAVASDSFAIPLIMGPTQSSTGSVTVTTYSDPADLLTNGYTNTSLEYVYATAMVSQAIRPTVFKVAQRSASGGLDADISAADAVDPTWYGLVVPSASDGDILTSAKQIESMTKIGIFASPNTDIGGTGTADLASQLKTLSLTRSGVIFSPASAALGIDAAIMGLQLPKPPGSSNWFGRNLNGIAEDTLTAQQQSACIGTPVAGISGKNANIYQSVGGIGIFEMGTMASGMFIDLRIGTDSLRSTIKTNIMSAVAASEKIPYTDQGCQIIAGCIRQAIDTHIGYNFIDPASPITVDHTAVSAVAPNTRKQRISPPFSFSCRTSGGINSVTVSGTINV
jgi:hypothetical protein